MTSHVSYLDRDAGLMEVIDEAQAVPRLGLIIFLSFPLYNLGRFNAAYRAIQEESVKWLYP